MACPICGHNFDRFRDDWNRPNAICWRCGSHERHRALWLYLKGFKYNKLGYASAMAIVLFVVAFTVVAIVIRRSRSLSGEQS